MPHASTDPKAYAVEHLLLIDQRTGILLYHQAGTTPCLKDVDGVAAMLTAIRDFVCDSFQLTSPPPLTPLSVLVGDITLAIEPGPIAFFVAVVRGNPPSSLRTTLQHAIARLHDEARPLLHAYADTGDMTQLRGLHRHVDVLFARLTR